MKRPHNLKPRGFTLVELIVVIAVVGLLAAVIAPQLFDKVDGSKAKIAVNQVENVANAISLYKLEVGSYPNALEDLVKQPAGATGWQGPYLKKKLLKDPWNNDLVYVQPGQHGRFDLLSYGSDGSLGGDGEDADITNWE